MRALALALALAVAAPSSAAPLSRVRRRYVISGAVLLGFFYTLPLVLALRYEEPELAVPVFGPLIDLRRCSGCTANAVEQGVVAGLVVDAALQALGASLLLVGARF